MFLHLGADIVVKQKHVVGVFDLETTSISKITKAYLAGMEKHGRVVNVSNELPKSYVVCRIDGETILYLSQISTATLLKRADFLNEIANV